MQRSETEFARIFESGKYLHLSELSDANLRTDDGYNFAIHRVMLARCSDYFRGIFIGMGKRRRKFHIPGISGKCLNEILCYIYTDDIRVTDRNITDLIIGADFLVLEDLKIKIKEYIKANLTEVNCLRILQVAHLLSDEYIFRKCFRFIQMRFQGLMRSHVDELTNLPLEIFGRILSNRSLYVYNETPVWQAIVAWTQKNIPLRKRCVPELLLTLAMEDVEEPLATEIVQHEIVSENRFMKDLVKVTSSKDLTPNLEVLLTFLRSYSNRIRKPILHHRIPLQLVIAWYNSSLYITYDENVDLCRQITALSRQPDVLIAMGHNIYIFEKTRKFCMNFDLRTMDWAKMKSLRNSYDFSFCVLVIDAFIYVIGETRGTCSVEVYNTATNSWCKGVPPPRNISRIAAVTIEKKVYVVGKSVGYTRMMTQMFDPDTQQWSILTPPSVFSFAFELVAYHQKICLIGSGSVEVYDPATNLWKKLPSMWTVSVSDIDDYMDWSTRAVVYNDQIIVSGNDGRGPYVYWNNVKECWEKCQENVILEGLLLKTSKFRFYTVDNVETIRMLTKQNRNPVTQMKNEIVF